MRIPSATRRLASRAPTVASLSLLVFASVTAAWTANDAPPGTRDEEPRPLAAIEAYRIGHFATSTVCAMCHAHSERASAMREPGGEPAAPWDLWSASMMANSARDPLWRAAVSVEVAHAPERAAEIEASCMRCHAPMATAQHRLHPGAAEPRLANLRHADPAVAQLALDGVSCTACHQIRAEGLGEERTLSGNYVIGHDEELFGPHAAPVPGPMVRHTGFTPVEGAHVLRSALCATCHTLVERDASGHAFYEQSPYEEWQNSIFENERTKDAAHGQSCQDCHMPRRDAQGRAIETRLAHNPGGRDFPFLEPRAPFGRHVFLGGNTLLPRVFQEFAQALGVTATHAQLERAIEETRAQLRGATADLEIVRARFADDGLEVDVRARNRTGHKFPTGIPIRRAFLRLAVRDEDGRSLFRSGGFDGSGRLVDGLGELLREERDPEGVLPHRDVIRRSDEAAVFETRLHDAAGRPTWRLGAAKGYLKDDRLLPLGWSPEHEAADATRPYGIGSDADFAGGSDVVHYRIALPRDLERATVAVELFYQPLSPSFRADLQRHDTPEVREWERYLERVGMVTERIASTTILVTR